eukprot:c19048_g1_i1 orf=256-1857(+)
MRSMLRAYHVRNLYGSYHTFRRSSAHTISSLVLLQQTTSHTASDTNLGGVLQQRGDARTGLDSDEDEKETTKELQHASTINSLLLEHIRVPRNQPIVSVLESWIDAGNDLGVYQMKMIFTRLEWQKKYEQALELSDWLIKEKPFELVEPHYARWLYYLGKVDGYEKAESGFSRIPLEFQKEVAYCRLFDIYLEYHKVDEAEGIMKRMKTQQISVPVYMCNNLITFYDKNLLGDKIPVLLKIMEEENILFSKQTYNILLACKSRNFDIVGMEHIWGLLKADTSVKPDFVSYTTLASAYFFAGQHAKAFAASQEAERDLEEHPATVKKLMKLITLYGSLKKEEDVGRVYQKLKYMPGQTSIPSYLSAIEAYGEAGLMDSAEEVMKEMELQRGMHHLVQFNTLLGVYCKNGKIKKAEEVLKKLSRKHKPDISTYSFLLFGYLKSGQSEKAEKIFTNVVTIIRGIGFNCDAIVSREWLLTIHRIVGLLGEKGDEKHAKSLLHALEASKFQNSPRSYHLIRKAYEQSFGCSWLDQATK